MIVRNSVMAVSCGSLWDWDSAHSLSDHCPSLSVETSGLTSHGAP